MEFAKVVKGELGVSSFFYIYRYTCPFVEKFSIEIETYYRPDAGKQANIFNLNVTERRQRIVGEFSNTSPCLSLSSYQNVVLCECFCVEQLIEQEWLNKDGYLMILRVNK